MHLCKHTSCHGKGPCWSRVNYSLLFHIPGDAWQQWVQNASNLGKWAILESEWKQLGKYWLDQCNYDVGGGINNGIGCN